MFNEILVVSKSLNHHRITNEIYDFSISKTKKNNIKNWSYDQKWQN